MTEHVGLFPSPSEGGETRKGSSNRAADRALNIDEGCWRCYALRISRWDRTRSSTGFMPRSVAMAIASSCNSTAFS